MTTSRPDLDKTRFWNRFLLMFSVFIILSSLLFNSPEEIYLGYMRIIKSPGLLLSDYMAIGNIGAAFFNVGLMTLLSSLLVRFTKTKISGVIIAGIFHITCFSFFGKTPLNGLAPVLGVYLYSKFKGVEFRSLMAFALFSTGVGPISSFFTFSYESSLVPSLVFGNLVALAIGFMLPPISKNCAKIHKGFNLYNNGFGLGLISIIVYSLFINFNIEVISENTLFRVYTPRLTYLMYGLFGSLVVSKFVFSREPLGNYLSLLKETGVAPTEFIGVYDDFTVIMNMGLVGLVGLSAILLVGGTPSGVTLGPLLASVGFAAFGCHIKNFIPTIVGVFLAASLGIYDINAESVISAAMFSSALSPFAGYYGVLSGLLAGFLHLAMVTRTGLLHGGFLLYNNGFSAGIVASVLSPLLESLRNKEDI